MPEPATFDFDEVDFITSDTHFSHARIIELAARPFASVEDMDAELIRRWNETVGPDAVVLHLGDLALGPIADSLPLTGQLHGRRLLVPGNHDRVSPSTQTARAVERFAPLYERAGWSILPEVIVGTRAGQSIMASHYPYSGDTQGDDRHVAHRPVDRGHPLLHGHTHDREPGSRIYDERRRRSLPLFAIARRWGQALRCPKSQSGSVSTSLSPTSTVAPANIGHTRTNPVRSAWGRECQSRGSLQTISLST